MSFILYVFITILCHNRNNHTYKDINYIYHIHTIMFGWHYPFFFFFSFRKMITIFIISSRFSLYSIRPFGYSSTLYLWDMWCLPLKHTKKNESTSCIFILKMGVKSLRILISVTSSCPFWHSSCSYSRRRMNSMAFSVATRLSSNHLPKMYFTSPVQCCYRYLPLV